MWLDRIAYELFICDMTAVDGLVIIDFMFW